MTVGNVTYDTRILAPGGGWWGTYYSRIWSGADRTRLPKPAHNTYETYREYTDFAGIVRRKDIKIRIPHPASSQNRVVKRVYEEEHAYSLNFQRTFHDRVQMAVDPFLWRSDMDAYGATTWAPADLFTSNDQIKLIGKLGDLLYGSDFNMGIALGELGDTLGLIGDTAGRLGGALGAARKGQFGLAADFLLNGTRRPKKPGHKNLPKSKTTPKMLADNWLELQYGWLPLLKDVEAGAQMLAHHLNTPVRQSYRVGGRREQVLPTRESQVGYNSAHKAYGTATRSHQRSLIARIEEKGTIPQFLGLTNPELVAWELVPYSFVADWFIPLGSWMSARALVSNLKGTFIQSDKRIGRAFTPTSAYFANSSRGNFMWVKFDRTVSTTLKVPKPRFKPLGQVASWQHCANAVGLLISGFAGKR
jgi:hypothetical protein